MQHFHTVRFNVQAHQSRPTIYWRKLWLCIRIRIAASAPVSQGAVPQQGIPARGESPETQWPQCWEEYWRKKKRLLQRWAYLSSLLVLSLNWSLTRLQGLRSLSFTPSLNPHLITHSVSCSLLYLLTRAVCTGVGTVASSLVVSNSAGSLRFIQQHFGTSALSTFANTPTLIDVNGIPFVGLKTTISTTVYFQRINIPLDTLEFSLEWMYFLLLNIVPTRHSNIWLIGSLQFWDKSNGLYFAFTWFLHASPYRWLRFSGTIQYPLQVQNIRMLSKLPL